MVMEGSVLLPIDSETFCTFDSLEDTNKKDRPVVYFTDLNIINWIGSTYAI